MAEARAMARSEAYRPRRNSDYASKTYTYMRGSVWQTGDSAGAIAYSISRALLVGAKSRMRRMRNAVINAVFPSTTFAWYSNIGLAYVGRDVFPAYADYVDHLPFLSYLPDGPLRVAASTVLSGTALWLAGIWGSRWALQALLQYRGFLYEGRRVSYATIAWLSAVRVFQGFGKAMTYSFQRVLPRLPVPSLNDTCNRYLESVRPLLDDAEYDRMERLAEEFKANEGAGFQRILWLKSWWANNYVSDWWERFVYLRARDSLMINSNYYIMDAYEWTPTKNQAARAGNMVALAMQHKRNLDANTVEPILINGRIPLCMQQHTRTFGTCRIPGKDEDVIQHVPDSHHVAVFHKGRYYVIDTLDKHGVRLSARDLEKQFTFILEDDKSPEPVFAEANLAAMTTANRNVWAEFRAMHMGEGVTRASLEAIERAAFVVVLDESSPENPVDTRVEANAMARELLHGKGYDRWFDKSFTMIVFANGRMGFNCEHTWADAPVAAHLFETMLAHEFSGSGYDQPSGVCKAVPQPKTFSKAPHRLRFDFDSEAERIVRSTLADAQKAIADLDQRVFMHGHYSKGLIKKAGISPDAWIQTALQLAYFRDQGKFAQTYEASMTRLYREGRTETVRPVTMDSVAFVRAMDDASVSKEEKIALFKKTTDHHVSLFRDAMAGKGVDRHLFALYVVSVWKGVNSQFLNEVLSVPWSLSTSQTPVQQTKLFDLQNNLNKTAGGGGFGPVTDDGYGVSYIVTSDSLLAFHVTSKCSSRLTDSTRFVKNIEQAMSDIKKLLHKD